ncbi:MAG: hypothetical protein ACRD6X_09160 [Pyrinomonadaceae bacterium]
MVDFKKRRERYMQDPLPIRLGGIAANLARISSVSANPANRDAVYSMLHESKHFIEWTAAEVPCDLASELVQLQIEMAVRQSSWEKRSESEEYRVEIGQWAKRHSNIVLQRSGLVDRK